MLKRIIEQYRKTSITVFLSILIGISFSGGYFAHDFLNQKKPDVGLNKQIIEIRQKVKLAEETIDVCQASYFSEFVEGGQVNVQKCANSSADFSEWSTKFIFHKDLLIVRDDILTIRDNLTRLSYIGLHIVEEKGDERDVLPLEIMDSITEVRQYISNLQ